MIAHVGNLSGTTVSAKAQGSSVAGVPGSQDPELAGLPTQKVKVTNMAGERVEKEVIDVRADIG